MASDQEIAKGVETLLRQSDPNSVTTLNGVVQQLEAKLGLDLSHKAGFIRDQINLLLRSHHHHPEPQLQPPKDHFALHPHPQFPTAPHLQQFPAHFTLHPHHPHHPQHHHRPVETHSFQQPPAPPPQLLSAQVQPHPKLPAKPDVFAHNAATVASQVPKERFLLCLFLFCFCFCFQRVKFWLDFRFFISKRLLYCFLLFLLKYKSNTGSSVRAFVFPFPHKKKMVFAFFYCGLNLKF